MTAHAAATRLRFARAGLIDVLHHYGHSGPQRRRLHEVADELAAVIADLDRCDPEGAEGAGDTEATDTEDADDDDRV